MKECVIKLVSIKDRLPDGYLVPLICVDPNGNSVLAMGYYDEDIKEWEIEFSENHPNSKDVKFWIDINWETIDYPKGSGTIKGGSGS